MKVLGIIPARGGSKRVIDKNIRLVAGVPLIAYTISAAGESEHLTDVVVSTDSEKIKAVAEESGGLVPFMRPDELAQDASPDRPMLVHALDFMEKANGVTYDMVVLLRPTSPFKTGVMIDQAVEMLGSSKADSLRTMTKAEGVFHPYWMFTQDADGSARQFDEKHSIAEYYQSNLLPPVFRLNGVVDVIRTSTLRNAETLYGKEMLMLEITEQESLDIDTEFELKLADLLMSQTD